MAEIMKTIDSMLFERLSSAAKKNPRLRQHHNFHEGKEERGQVYTFHKCYGLWAIGDGGKKNWGQISTFDMTIIFSNRSKRWGHKDVGGQGDIDSLLRKIRCARFINDRDQAS